LHFCPADKCLSSICWFDPCHDSAHTLFAINVVQNV
jgi:hypothetical protein